MKKNNKGFTLVEILAVIVILGIIMIVALPTYSNIYNSIRLTTYLNNIKTIKSAALDYGSNPSIKDSVKKLHDNTSSSTENKDWCKTISVTNLIKSGYLASDDDNLDQITDVFTGSAMGYNIQNKYNVSYPVDGVALCYCDKKLDIDAFVIKDLDRDQVYHAGEYIRNYVYDDATYGSANIYEFRELKISFVYNDVFKAIVKAKNKEKVNIEGVECRIGNLFDGITGDLTLDNEELVKKINNFIFTNDNLTYKSTCMHS